MAVTEDAISAPATPRATLRRAQIVTALAPAAVYLAIRLVGVVGLAVMAARNGSTLADELTSWDGYWLLAIADDGYAGVPSNLVDAFGQHTPDTSLGFFPGYPSIVAMVGLLIGGNLVAAGLIVSVVAGVVAAYGLTRLGTLVPGGSRRAGLLLVGLFAATPMSVVLSMTYTEALFCALAVWALVAVLEGHWLLAGVCTASAGVVRPTASALVAAVGLAALAAALSRRDGLRPWIGGLLAASGLLGYLGYVGVRTGELDGWSAIQREGWGWGFDGGVATAGYVGRVLGSPDQLFDVLTVLALLAGLILLGLAIRMRLPWPLLVYGAVGLATIWGTQGLMNTKLRLLVPVIVVLIPPAVGLARRRTSTVVIVLVAATLASGWFGGYALTVWQYAI
ncbi:MAG: hypothetical protein ACRDRK_09680 [Pseudonocardia sp.]